jgi:tetratricopeptide (TPR) repeat protein
MDTDLANSSRPEDRTDNLINNFLSSTSEFNIKRNNRPLTVADATTDYATYLLELDDIQPEVEKQDDLINTYINNNNGSERIVLQEEPTYTPKLQNQDTDDGGDEFFTETLAKIYTKQGNYDKAIEIITKLNLNYPKKSSYFADQLRFLRKLQLINNKTKQ